MGAVTFLTDGLRNLISRLGTKYDKSTGTEYQFIPLSTEALHNAYRGAWLPKKIVDIPAFDAVRKWRDWQADAEEISKIEKEEQRLGIKKKVMQAKINARLFGGAAIYIGTGDSDPSLPLNVKAIKAGGIRFLTVLSRLDITPGQIETNAETEGYGKPKFYSIGTGIEIHPSRLVIFIGNDVPLLSAASVVEDGWGDSVLQAVYDEVRRSDSTSANIASLVFEAKVDVFKIPNFMRNMGDDAYQKAVEERVRLASLAKGNLASLLMDKEEEYEQKQFNFSGMTDVLMAFVQLCAGAADIPVTRLLGQSPQGMNSTGESDLKNYYDRVSSIQELEIQPAMQVLDRAIVRSALGKDREDIHYVWSSLWQTSDTEKSEISKRAADTIKVLSDSDLFPEDPLAEAAVTMLTETGAIPGLEAAIKKWAELAPDPETNVEGESELEAIATEPQEAGDRFDDAEPRSLYVSRKVLNADEILAWARDQGIGPLLEASDLHVTIAYSRTPVDWIEIGEAWVNSDPSGELLIKPGGPRVIELFGKEKSFLVLAFASTDLAWRHREIIERGASWDWPEYNPHITLSEGYSGDASSIEPYHGKIRLGPEIFEEVK